jgi:hypothetical protein
MASMAPIPSLPPASHRPSGLASHSISDATADPWSVAGTSMLPLTDAVDHSAKRALQRFTDVIKRELDARRSPVEAQHAGPTRIHDSSIHLQTSFLGSSIQLAGWVASNCWTHPQCGVDSPNSLCGNGQTWDCQSHIMNRAPVK